MPLVLQPTGNISSLWTLKVKDDALYSMADMSIPNSLVSGYHVVLAQLAKMKFGIEGRLINQTTRDLYLREKSFVMENY